MDFKERKKHRKEYFEKYVKGWRMRNCTACNGSGYYDNSVNGVTPKCSSCEGTGKERYCPIDNNKFRPSKKHLAIFKTIIEKGFYKPSSSDQEPSTKTLINNKIVEWRDDYRGVIFTEEGKELVIINNWI